MQMVPLFLVGSGEFGMDAQLSFGSDHASALCLPLMSLYSKGMATTGMVLLELRDFGWKFVITMLTTKKRQPLVQLVADMVSTCQLLIWIPRSYDVSCHRSKKLADLTTTMDA